MKEPPFSYTHLLTNKLEKKQGIPCIFDDTLFVVTRPPKHQIKTLCHDQTADQTPQLRGKWSTSDLLAWDETIINHHQSPTKNQSTKKMDKTHYISLVGIYLLNFGVFFGWKNWESRYGVPPLEGEPQLKHLPKVWALPVSAAAVAAARRRRRRPWSSPRRTRRCRRNGYVVTRPLFHRGGYRGKSPNVGWKNLGLEL